MALIGVVVGSLLFGWLTDRIGRQIPMQIGAGVGLVSAFASCVVPTYAWLLVGRFFVGVTIGGLSQVYAEPDPLFRSHSLFVHLKAKTKTSKNERMTLTVIHLEIVPSSKQ